MWLSTSYPQVLADPVWPNEFPFTEDDFKRFDETPDSFFYGQPRFVTHIDDGAIAALTKCGPLTTTCMLSCTCTCGIGDGDERSVCLSIPWHGETDHAFLVLQVLFRSVSEVWK